MLVKRRGLCREQPYDARFYTFRQAVVSVTVRTYKKRRALYQHVLSISFKTTYRRLQPKSRLKTVSGYRLDYCLRHKKETKVSRVATVYRAMLTDFFGIYRSAVDEINVIAFIFRVIERSLNNAETLFAVRVSLSVGL